MLTVILAIALLAVTFAAGACSVVAVCVYCDNTVIRYQGEGKVEERFPTIGAMFRQN